MQKEIPQVCISNFTIRYAPKKEMSKIKSDSKAVRDKAVKAHVKEFKMNLYPITLNKNNDFPTKVTKERVLSSIWKYKKIKGDYSNFIVFIKDVSVVSRSNVSYKFDYDKD
jgi:hypothetical protein